MVRMVVRGQGSLLEEADFLVDSLEGLFALLGSLKHSQQHSVITTFVFLGGQGVLARVIKYIMELHLFHGLVALENFELDWLLPGKAGTNHHALLLNAIRQVNLFNELLFDSAKFLLDRYACEKIVGVGIVLGL